MKNIQGEIISMDGFKASRIKFENIQCLRGIAVMFVVVVHLIAIETKYGHGVLILPHVIFIGVAAVDIFFVISGFIMAATIQGKFQDKPKIMHFLAHRIARIYPLYWFYSCLALAVFLIHPAWVNQSQHHEVNILKSFLLLPQQKLPLIEVGWTLIYEVYFYAVIIFLLLFPEKRFITLLAVWGLLALVGGLVLPVAASPVLTVMTKPLCYEFIAGCLIAKLAARKMTNKSGSFMVLMVGLVCLGIGFRMLEIPHGWARVLVYGMPGAMIVYAAIALEFQGVFFPAFFARLGDASYSIYLSHVMVLAALGRIWALLPESHWAYHVLALGVMLAAAIVVGRLSYRYIEKPLIAYARTMLQTKREMATPVTN